MQIIGRSWTFGSNVPTRFTETAINDALFHGPFQRE